MGFDPRKFIDISRELNIGNTEAHYRTVVNRAYYGAFGHIRNSLNIYVSDASVHQAVIRTLINSESDLYKIVGKRLETLFKKRKDADYKYNSEIKQHACQFCVNEAEEILKIFSQAEDE